MPEWPHRINEEMRQHLDDEYDALRARGAGHDEAMRRLAGDVDELASTRSRRAGAVSSDVRFAWRALRKTPGFTTVVVLTLALGIGANAAIFSVVNAVVLRPLPYPDAARLMVVWGNLHRPGVEEIPASAGEYVDYRDQVRSLERVAAYDTLGFNLTGGGEPERVDGAVVTASVFPLLGVNAQVGRMFAAAEEQPGHDHVAILSHALWTRRFHADPAIVGQMVAVDGRPVEIVGVMPAAFRFPDETTELWRPILLDAEALGAGNRGSHGFTVLARLKRGISREQARADFDTAGSAFQARFPGNYRNGFSTTVRPLQDEIVGDTSRALFVLLGAVGLVDRQGARVHRA